MTTPLGVLFVCMGNICRSPMAEGVARQRIERAGLIDRVRLDSAGTHSYHAGDPPDRRAQAAAHARGIDISAQRARRVEKADFERFDLVLAADEENLARLHALAPRDQRDRARLFMTLAPHLGVTAIPDPYYGADDGFEHALDLIEAASDGLVAELRARLDA